MTEKCIARTIRKKKNLRVHGGLWWTINGTAATALSALRLMIAGRMRIGLATALPTH